MIIRRERTVVFEPVSLEYLAGIQAHRSARRGSFPLMWQQRVCRSNRKNTEHPQISI